MPDEEKPRERLLKIGSNNLNNEELLSIILSTGTKNKSVKDLSMEILKEVKNINELKNVTINKLMNIKGIGYTKAITLIASLELGKRVYSNNEYKKEIKINSSYKVYEYFKDKLIDKKQEYFYVLYLNTKKNIIKEKLLFKGTLSSSDVHPREIFKYAYLYSASAIICIHNHPTGEVTPSDKDIEITNRLIKTGDILGISFLDHIIIGNDKYYSFFEGGEQNKKV